MVGARDDADGAFGGSPAPVTVQGALTTLLLVIDRPPLVIDRLAPRWDAPWV